MDYKKQAPEPYPRRRGRTPKPTDHPIGRLIRERRTALGLSLAALAEQVGIGPTSVSLLASMEHGTLPPRRDIAEKLADVLGIDRELLIEWSTMRVSQHAPGTVLEQRREYDSSLRESWETRIEAIEDSASLMAFAARTAAFRARLVESDGTLPDAPPNTIPVYPAGADPDRFRGRLAAHVDRALAERLVQGKADLIRPIAYLISDDDLDRLRRPAYPDTPPTYAVVSRPLPVTIDPREPYAIRFDRRVILAYCAWDGRELVVLDPPGHRGFARLKARSADSLEDLVVGQVVALSWWPIG